MTVGATDGSPARRSGRPADRGVAAVTGGSTGIGRAICEDLLAQGFDGFLRKPFHVRQVIEAVEDAMAVVY